jgi:phospholipase/carboxylesterase
MTELVCERYVPADASDGGAVVVLLHGRGSDAPDLMGLQPHLPADWAVVAPRAPFAGAPWGYGPGWAWYRYLGEDRPEEASYWLSVEAVRGLLSSLPELVGFRPGGVVLGGFSQGGTLSLGYALARNAGHLGAYAPDAPLVLNLSGFLASHPRVAASPDTVRGVRVFWGHGTQDANIPFAMAEQGRAALRAAGADLEARDYRIGHTISRDELADAVEWMRAGLAQLTAAAGD